MKRLSLIRHAKSDWNNIQLSDYHRPLNKRGLENAPVMGKRLFTLYGTPDLIITSGAKRAFTTAEFFASNSGYDKNKIITNDEIYLASSSTIIQTIQSIDNQFSNVWIFSHNPGISETIIELTDRDLELKTCCVCVIEKDIKKWSKIKKGSCHIINHITPKDHHN